METKYGQPHLPAGLIGAIVLFAFIVVLSWLGSKSSPEPDEEASGRALAAKRALTRAWLPIARVVRRKRPDADGQRPSTSSMS
jgi:hypothetical protein